MCPCRRADPPLTVLAQMFGLPRRARARSRAGAVVEQGGRIAFAVPQCFGSGFGVVGATLSMAAAAAAAPVAAATPCIAPATREDESRPTGGVRLRMAASDRQLRKQIWAVAILVILSRTSDARAVASSAQRSRSRSYAARLQRFRVPLLARDRPALGSRRERGARSAPEKRDTVGRHVRSPSLRRGDRASGPALADLRLEVPCGRPRRDPDDNRDTAQRFGGTRRAGLIMTGLVGWDVHERGRDDRDRGVAAVRPPLRADRSRSERLSHLVGTSPRRPPVSKVHDGTELLAPRPVLAATVPRSWSQVSTTTSPRSSLLGTAAMGTLLVVAYAVILLRVVGISSVDRRTLRQAFRP